MFIVKCAGVRSAQFCAVCGERDGVVRRVDLDQRKLRRVVAQAALGVADALRIELLRGDRATCRSTTRFRPGPSSTAPDDLHAGIVVLRAGGPTRRADRRRVRRRASGLPGCVGRAETLTTCESAPPAGPSRARLHRRFRAKAVISSATRGCSAAPRSIRRSSAATVSRSTSAGRRRRRPDFASRSSCRAASATTRACVGHASRCCDSSPKSQDSAIAWPCCWCSCRRRSSSRRGRSSASSRCSTSCSAAPSSASRAIRAGSRR